MGGVEVKSERSSQELYWKSYIFKLISEDENTFINDAWEAGGCVKNCGIS